MKRYDSYKDSGIEWIGEVPSHWEVIPFKRIMRIKNGQDYKDFAEEDGYPVVGSGGCFAYCSKYIYDGEAILLGRKGTIDKPLYINGKFWTVDTMFYAYPKTSSNMKFMYYQSLTIPFDKYKTSTALPSMTQTDLGYNIFCVPPIGEQQAIASYLDKRCGEIDRAIAKQQKRIELLQELRQSIITNAVTRGINPDAPLKDSGVEWIGQVPEHWEVCRLKFLMKLINGRAYSQKELLECGKYKVLRVGNFFTNDTWYYSDMELGPDKYCHKGDLLYAWSASFGPHIWDEDKTIFHYHIWKVRLSPKITKNYAYFVLDAISNYKRGDVHGSTMVHITMDSMNNSYIVLPTLLEQESIVKFIETETTRIDKLVSNAEHQIDLLQELKQSIITEVVTGKRKVC